MADKKISELTTMGSVDCYTDRIMVIDSSRSADADKQTTAVISDCWASDSDFSQLLDVAPSVENGDFVLIYDTSTAAYRKATKSQWYSGGGGAPTGKGLLIGGFTYGSAPGDYNRSCGQVLAFNTGTFSISGTLDISSPRASAADIHGSGTAGYIASGATRTNSELTDAVDIVTYGTETSSLSSSVVPTARWHCDGLTGDSGYHYMMMGNNTNECHRFNPVLEQWGTVVVTDPPDYTPIGKRYCLTLDSGGTKGVILPCGIGGLSTVDNFTYSSETFEVGMGSGDNDQKKDRYATAIAADTFGLYIAGDGSNTAATVSFSGHLSLLPSADYPAASECLYGSNLTDEDQTYGYMCGGLTGSTPITYIIRIDLSTTIAATYSTTALGGATVQGCSISTGGR
jgi:hypothetical protein